MMIRKFCERPTSRLLCRFICLCLVSSLGNLISVEIDPDNSAALSKVLKQQKEFVLFTMPKTGTHLMVPLLERITGRIPCGANELFPINLVTDQALFISFISDPLAVPFYWFMAPVRKVEFSDGLNQLKVTRRFFYEHTPYSRAMEGLLEKRSCTVFFILRDPRDYVISMVNFLRKVRIFWFNVDWFNTLTIDQQIHYVITGTDWYNSASAILNSFIKWKDSPICCTLRFEALLGPQGGHCSQTEQINELRKIRDVLNKKITDFELLQIVNEVYGTGWSFHKGKVGAWKEYFNEEHKALFKKLLGKELIQLGYEKDDNW